MRSAINRLMVLATLSIAVVGSSGAAARLDGNCRVAGELTRLDGLREASGVAASRRTPGVFWVHNDSAAPVIVALDRQGASQRRVRVTGARVDDWEDIAVGPCAKETCIYIGDIGDNQNKRTRVTLYRVAEPTTGAQATAPAEAFDAAYPDGPHDAEALFVTRDGEVFIITKGDPGPVALFRFPKPLVAGRLMTLERVGVLMKGTDIPSANRPTSADASADGEWVAVRTTEWIAFHRTSDLIAGRWQEAFRTDVSRLGEPRGEGITFDGPTAVVLVGEGGGPLAGAGTFKRLPCTLNR